MTRAGAPRRPNHGLGLRHVGVAIALAACGCGAAVAAHLSNAPTGANATVNVNPGVVKNPINPELFGVIMNWPTDAEGAYDPPNNEFFPAFKTMVQNMGIGSIRFVDGNGGREAYEWERAIGPQSSRTWNRVVNGKAGQPSTVGSDEIGKFVANTNSHGVAITNFYRETAQYAADWVAYMTAPQSTPNTDPSDPGYWAALRATNGHSNPYPIDYFDVGNEQDLVPGGWTTGSSPVVSSPHSASCDTLTSTNTTDCLYAFGGTTSYSNQKVVRYASLAASAAGSDGSSNQVFYASYPPVKTGQTVFVDGTGWTAESSLTGGGNIYTIDHTTGEIDFGNGTNGAIPPNGSTITISYDSGPHDGFVDFYSAMKEMNPNIKVCAQDSNQAFLAAMGTTYPYDCVAWHGALGDGYPSSKDSSGTCYSDLQFEQAELAAPDTQTNEEQAVQTRVNTASGTTSIPVVLTAYGHKHGNQPCDDTTGATHLNLTDGLLEARQLEEFIHDGVPLAHRFLLTDEFFNPAGPPDDFAAQPAQNAVIESDGSANFVEEPDGLAMQLMSNLAGDTQVQSTVSNNPQITTVSGSIRTLATVASTDSSGNVQLVVVNQDLANDLSATVSVTGFTHSSTANIETLNASAPGTENTESNPNAVKITPTNPSVGTGSFSYTFPAHSVTLISLTKS